MINYIQLAIAIVASLVVPMLALAAMWGKHTESVKNQHAKNIEQDERADKQDERAERQDDKINALRTLITEREDILRKHIDSRFNRLDSKLDRIFDNIK